jgi:dimeric dUTPase (all-alpha-NTP-PPase superfamily)
MRPLSFRGSRTGNGGKKKVEFDENQAREELIDILHFVVQTAIELNISPQAILDEYLKKNEINRQRHLNDY